MLSNNKQYFIVVYKKKMYFNKILTLLYIRNNTIFVHNKKYLIVVQGSLILYNYNRTGPKDELEVKYANLNFFFYINAN